MAHDPAVLFNRLLTRGRLRHLQLLVALADAGSVQRAAGAVGMSQPAATQALSDLEALLETALFERHTRGVRLTRFGEAVVPVARNVLQALRASADTLASLHAGARAFMRIGCIPAAASGLLARVLPAFLQSQEGLRIELIEENTVQLLPELAAGRLEAVVCRRPADMPAPWQFELLQPDEPVILVAPDHPLAGKRALALKKLAAHAWILPPPGMGVRDFHEALWAGMAVRPVVHPMSTTALAVVVEVLRTQHAVSVMPRSIAQSLVDAGVAVVLDVKLPQPMDRMLEGLGLLTTGFADTPALAALRVNLRAASRRT